MTVKSNYVTATLSNWLKNLVPVFQSMKSKIGTINCVFFLGFEQEIEKNSDWFLVLFAPMVIGRINWFTIGFSTVI